MATITATATKPIINIEANSSPNPRWEAKAASPSPAARPANGPIQEREGAAAAAPAVAPDANALRLRALEAQYRRIGNNPELAGEKALVLKQIEDVQQTIRAESATPPEAKFMRALGLPLTTAGFAEFEALKQRPGEFERLLSQSGLPKTDQTALIRQRLKKEVTHAPGTSVTLVQEKAERGRFGELLVKQYEDISKAAGLATKTLPLALAGRLVTDFANCQPIILWSDEKMGFSVGYAL
jgi:hypothetical protein